VLSGAGLLTAPGAGSGVHWVEHLRVSDLSAGTYSIAAGADDDQEPQTEDEARGGHPQGQAARQSLWWGSSAARLAPCAAPGCAAG
jgi:hypothetical protein